MSYPAPAPVSSHHTANCVLAERNLTIDLAEYDVERPENGRHVGQHVAAVHEVHGLQVRKTRCADLAALFAGNWPAGGICQPRLPDKSLRFC